METQYISLNMTPSGVNPIFHISQYDVGRLLGFYVYNGSEVVDLDDYTCTVEATRTDGTQITTNVITNNNSGIFAVTATMSNVADKYNCQLVIVDRNTNRVASLPFIMDVVTAALNGNDSSIYNDRTLYQQYNASMQGALANEANNRINADNLEKATRQSAVNTLQNNINAETTERINAITAEATERINAITAEATARQSADNTLQGNINSEAATRASADSNLQSQINQIIAPSGEAPSAAEVQNARIGADGVTYDTLGNAIRGQVGDLKSALINNVGTRLSTLDGFIAPVMEKGGIAFGSTSIAFQNRNDAVRTPQSGIRVNIGDIVGLTNYTDAKYKYAVLKDSDGKYKYSDFLTADTYIIVAGVLFVDVRYADDREVSNIGDLASLVRINKHNGIAENASEHIDLYTNILENGELLSRLFATGEISNSAFVPSPAGRKYRVATISKLQVNYDISISAKNGYRFSISTFANYDSPTGEWSGWLTELTIPANSIVLVMLAKVTEDTSVTADPVEFVTHYVVSTDLTNRLHKEAEVDTDAISEYMAHFYLSDTTKSEEYAFFTDPHLMGTNGTFSEDLFKRYIDDLESTIKRTSAFYVVCGGDWLNSGDTKEQASVKLGYVDGQMRNRFPRSYYPIVGNHDFNYMGVDGNGNRLSEANWIGNHDMPSFWFQQYGECYYKFKAGIAQNYVLNTRTDHDGTDQYDEEMLDWLASSLIEDDPEHATLMFHIYRLLGEASTIPTRILAIGEIISAFNSHSICTLTEETHGYDKSYDFTNTTGHIDYSMVGHSHADFIQTLGGVPIIATRNMQSGDIPTYDLVFADYTHGKLYLTRVGSGESRSVNI